MYNMPFKLFGALMRVVEGVPKIVVLSCEGTVKVKVKLNTVLQNKIRNLKLYALTLNQLLKLRVRLNIHHMEPE